MNLPDPREKYVFIGGVGWEVSSQFDLYAPTNVQCMGDRKICA